MMVLYLYCIPKPRIMKKSIVIKLVVLKLFIISVPQLGNAQNSVLPHTPDYYLFIDTTASIKVTYSYVNGELFTEQFLDKKLDTNGHSYYIRIRAYTHRNDTSYFRGTDDNFVSLDRKTLSETIVIPKKPFVGQTWEGAEGNWKYVVKDIDASLVTPAKNYTGLVNIEAIQQTGADKNKFKKYNNFYARGIGYVGSVIDDRLFTYWKKAKALKK